eukprot:gene4296-6091_t
METNVNSPDSDLECRVCRCGADNDQLGPLYTPCLCTGSIGLVHQECLEAWLAHSKKESCELCNAKYQFVPLYAEGTPATLPFKVLLRSVFLFLIRKILPYTLRLITAVLIWLVIVPFSTTCIYYICIGHKRHDIFFQSISSNIISGIVIDAVIALSLLILMSFTDFLRFHWNQNGNNQNNNQNNGLNNNPMNNNANANNNRNNNVRRVDGVNRNNNRNPAVINIRQRRGIPRPQPAQLQTNNKPDNQEFKNRNNAIHPIHIQGKGISHDDRLDEGILLDESPLKRRNTQLDQDAMVGSKKFLFPSDEDNTLISVTKLSGNDTNESDSKKSYDSSSNPYEKLVLNDSNNNIIINNLIDNHTNDEAKLNDSKVMDDIWYGQFKPLVDKDEHPMFEGFDMIDELNESNPNQMKQNRADTLETEINTNEVNQNELNDHIVEQEFEENVIHDNVVQDDEDEIINNANADQNNNNNNNNNDLNANNLNLNIDDVQEVGVEIRVALFELLGLDGPFHFMFRNALWLVGFSSLYMTTLGSLPYLIGKMITQIIFNRINLFLMNMNNTIFIDQLKSNIIVRSINFVILFSNETTNAIQIIDVYFIGMGFVTIFCVVFLLNLSVGAVNSFFINRHLSVIVNLVNKTSVVVKVGGLLVMRIFILPILLGSMILFLATNTILHSTIENWASFLSSNIVGCLSLAWVSGITFMLTMTISVLQLREVVHPAIFAKIIRPQEAHIDLITSLVNESGLTHIRRIFISMLVYMFLMMILVAIPMKMTENLIYFGLLPAYDVRLWYITPQIQLPLELMFCHITFLSILDKKKDIIGKIQYEWLLKACAAIGLTRYIIPFPMIKKSMKYISRNNVNLDASNDQEDYLIGKPLPRPPPGWDNRTANSSRWAWGTEEPSALEKNVAPRVIPSYWLLRCALLLTISITLINIITTAGVVTPLIIGRQIYSISQIPSWLCHDPICFVVGYFVISWVIDVLIQMRKQKLGYNIFRLFIAPFTSAANRSVTIKGVYLS